MADYITEYDGLYKVSRLFLWLTFGLYFAYEIVRLPILPLLMVAAPLYSPLIPHAMWLVSIPTVLWALRLRSNKRSYVLSGAIAFWMLAVYLTVDGRYDFSILDVILVSGVCVAGALFIWLLSRPGVAVQYFRQYFIFVGLGFSVVMFANAALGTVFPSLQGGEGNLIFYTPAMLFGLPVMLLSSAVLVFVRQVVRRAFRWANYYTKILMVGTAMLTGMAIALGMGLYFGDMSMYFLIPIGYASLLLCFVWPIIRRISYVRGSISLTGFDESVYPVIWSSSVSGLTALITIIALFEFDVL